MRYLAGVGGSVSTFEVIAVDSNGVSRDAWIVDAVGIVDAMAIGRQQAMASKLPPDDYTFEVHPCTVAGHRLKNGSKR